MALAETPPTRHGASRETAERRCRVPRPARFVRAEHLDARLLARPPHGADAGDRGRARRARRPPGRARPPDRLGCWRPIFLVVANFIEWMVHRHPMHRPQPPRLMYRNHALLHHLAFTDGNMPIDPPGASWAW